MNRSHLKAITLFAMCLAIFMFNLNDTIVNVTLPKIQTSLGSNVSGLQWILNGYTLAATVLVMPSGTLGDIYGRKRVFLGGLVIVIIASLICSLAPNLGTLIAGRILQGTSDAVVLPISLCILADTFPEPGEKAKAIGIWSAVSGLALVAGPVLGGLLADTFGWRSVFFFNVPLSMIAFWITSRFVKEVTNQKKQRLDVPGLFLCIVFLASLTYALTEGNALAWQSPRIVFLLVVAGLSLAGFLVIESRSSHPMLPLQLFQNQTFAVVSVVQILVFFTFISLVFIFSLFLQQVQGYSAVAAGVRFLPMNGAFVIASLVSAWLCVRFGRRFTIVMGLIMAGLATLSLTRISANTEYGTILWRLVISGFGAGLTISPLTTAAISSAPPTKAGIVSGILNICSGLGGILGIAIQGSVFRQQLASELGQSLTAWNIPSNLQDRLIANALRGGASLSSEEGASIAPAAMQQAISSAFVSGLHTTVIIASIALLTGALLILVFLRPSFIKFPKNFGVFARKNRN